jgi:hypothetical protein
MGTIKEIDINEKQEAFKELIKAEQIKEKIRKCLTFASVSSSCRACMSFNKGGCAKFEELKLLVGWLPKYNWIGIEFQNRVERLNNI